VSFDPYAPYGQLIESTVRLAIWNVWGRYGEDWSNRQAGIEETLLGVTPDLVCLVEAWRQGETTQSQLVASKLGLPHHHFVGDWEQEDWVSGIGVVSRWPMSAPVVRPLRDAGGSGFGQAVHVAVNGDRGLIQLFVAMLDYPLGASALRQAQVRELAQFVSEEASGSEPTLVCGDFNAGPDSDEVRMLTGRSSTAVSGLVFYDAWEMAGDGTPGYTWSNRNPLASAGLYPDRRFDYIFSAWPRLHGAGHPIHCSLLGVRPADQMQLSDHYGILADMRY
jgi:endonuclease/exonuclease/phosphatase family metal-dependent hydrolase